VNRVACLTAAPTAQAIAAIVTRKFRDVTFEGKPPNIWIDRMDAGYVRIQIEGIKGVVITAHDY
jgi:hypothetical protein